MFRRDSFVAIILFIFSLGVGIQASRYPIGSGLKRVGPGFFPLVIAILLGALSVALLVKSIIHSEKGDKPIWPEQFLSLIVIMVAVFAYGFLLEYLGFPLNTFLFSFALFKYEYPHKWLLPFIGGLTTSIFSFFIFKMWLNVSFPHGILGL
jgi:hypothetical protein